MVYVMDSIVFSHPSKPGQTSPPVSLSGASVGNESPPLSLFLSPALRGTPLGYQKYWEGCVYIFAKLLKKKSTGVAFVKY